MLVFLHQHWTVSAKGRTSCSYFAYYPHIAQWIMRKMSRCGWHALIWSMAPMEDIMRFIALIWMTHWTPKLLCWFGTLVLHLVWFYLGLTLLIMSSEKFPFGMSQRSTRSLVLEQSCTKFTDIKGLPVYLPCLLYHLPTSERQNRDLAKLILTADQINLLLL